MNREIRLMIGMDDTIEFFGDVAGILMDNDVEVDKDFSEKYTRAMNRLRYIREKEVGKEPKKIKKLHGSGYFIKCGNCGSETIKEVGYKFCPNCGYAVKGR